MRELIPDYALEEDSYPFDIIWATFKAEPLKSFTQQEL